MQPAARVTAPAGVRFDYSRSMAAWLHTFPAEQFYVVQVG